MQDEEQHYYLPHAGTGLEKEWQQSAEQAKYTELCARGHDIIANRIIQAREGDPPKPVTMKELYRLAGSIRRAIAIEAMDESHKNRNLYGHPLSDFERQIISESIVPPYYPIDNRYRAYHSKANQAYNNIITAIKTYQFKEQFGQDYDGIHESDRENGETITIRRNDLAFPIARILRKDDIIELEHSPVGDHDALLAMADEHLQRMISTPDLSDKTFWQEMGGAALDLYHATPLRLGSQTATLMVLAGISKAMGYEVVPRESDPKRFFDHFMAAELTPYEIYKKEYKEGFVRFPKKVSHPQN